MCTLVFGLGLLGPRSLVLATNRDEDPARASEPPQILHREPLVVGGRDAVAGGTWLAVRAGGATHAPGVALLLNRRDPEPGRAGRRSRGLLTLNVAAAADPRATALAEAASGRYAPCSLVWLSHDASWLLALRAGREPTLEPIAPGWHAITHFELDDAADARAGFQRRRRGAAARLDRHARGARHTGGVPARWPRTDRVRKHAQPRAGRAGVLSHGGALVRDAVRGLDPARAW
jgi:hypothetical protein